MERENAFSAFRNILVLFSLSYSFIAGIFGVLLLAKGFDIAQVGLYYSIYYLAIFILQAPAGAFADAYGRKTAIAASAITQMAFLAMFAFLPAVQWMLALALLSAGTEALFTGASEAHGVDLLGRQKNGKTQRLLASARSFEFAAIILGAAVGGAASVMSPNAPVFLCFIFAAANLAYCLFSLHEPARARRKMRHALSESFSFSLSSSSARLIIAISLLLGAGFFAINSYWQVVLSQEGLGNGAVGLFFGVMNVAMIIGFRASNSLRASWKAVSALLALLAACLLLSGILPSAAMFMAAIILLQVAYGAYVPVEGAILNNATPSRIRATVLSLKAMAFRAGMAAFGLVLYAAGDAAPRLLWAQSSIFLLAGALLALFQARKENQEKS
ncbi:Major Facilitator Superfamily protein [uncultured archaeon]|nr:Major Facilitator Superfamily protein [uncultured archaeon]